MKQELPIAVGLLALGAVLCFNLGEQAPPVSQAAIATDHASVIQQVANWENVTTPKISKSTTPEPDHTQPTNFNPLSDELNPSESLQPNGDSSFGRIYPAKPWLSIATAPNSRVSKEKIHAIGTALSAAPPMATRTALDCELFGVQLSAHGKYFQSDASKKTRMELTFDHPSSPHLILQVSDSNFVYTLRTDANKKRLEFIDLGRLENKDALLTSATLPTSWVTSGGIGETFKHYAGAFSFRQEEYDDPTVMVFRGIWDAEALLNLVYSDVPTEERPKKVFWAKIPAQIPHAIELVFSKHETGLIQPKRIAFFKFGAVQGKAVAKEVVQIRFEPMVLDLELDDDLFTLESLGFDASEMTEVYNQKIREFSAGLPKVANELPAADLQTR